MLADCSKSKFCLQELVFQRWINHILKRKRIIINNLYDDLSNGIDIVHLVESLTLHEFKSKIKFPSFQTQKIENINMVLKYLHENEKIKFFDIDSTDILNKESKMILSFLWQIIQYFSIEKPLELYFELQNYNCLDKSIKQKFLIWLKSKVIPMNVRNLSSDFKDGILIGTLVNNYNNHLCADWRLWKDNNAMENAETAIQTAANSLGIPELINPDELVNCQLDERSLMTYLSQFISLEYENKKGNGESIVINGLDRSSYSVNESISVTIKTNGQEKVKLKLTNPYGDSCFVDCTKSLAYGGDRFLLYRFTPLDIGEFWLLVMSCDSNRIIASSIILVMGYGNYKNPNFLHFQNNNSLEQLNDEDLVSLFVFKGRGIQQRGIRMNDIVEFQIQVSDIRKINILSFLYVSLKSPEKETPELLISHKDGDSLKYKYTPKNVGIYEIQIKCKNNLYRKAFKIQVAEMYDLPVVAFGPGLKYANTTDSAVFIVETNKKIGLLNFTIEGPSETEIECKDNGDGSVTITYQPPMEGEYVVHIFHDNKDIQNSPFIVDAVKCKNNVNPVKTKVYGPSLDETAIVTGKDAYFVVDIKDTNGTFDDFLAECFDNFGNIVPINFRNEDEFIRKYYFTSHKEIKLVLFITFNNISVPGSPFSINFVENTLFNKLKIEGSGLKSAFFGKEASFCIDCTGVPYSGNLEVMVTDSNLHQIPCIVESNDLQSDIYTVKYTPSYNITKCLIEIFFNKIPVYDEPLIVPITPGTYEKNKSIQNNWTIQSQMQQYDLVDRVPSQLDFEIIRKDHHSRQNYWTEEFSDVFLNPNSDSLLKLFVPPVEILDTSSDFQFPSNAENVLNEIENNSHESGILQCPLSTVFEESEENFSVRDSIFSSRTHSRASVRDEFFSLSRRSSFTIVPSPNNFAMLNQAKSEIASNRSGSYYLANNIIPQCFPLPPPPTLYDKKLINDSDINYDENESAQLPEPPSDLDLLKFNNEYWSSAYSEIKYIDICLENFESTCIDFPAFHLSTCQFIMEANFFIHLQNEIFSLRIPKLINHSCHVRASKFITPTSFNNNQCFSTSYYSLAYAAIDYKELKDESLTEVLPLTGIKTDSSKFDDSNEKTDISTHSKSTNSNYLNSHDENDIETVNIIEKVKSKNIVSAQKNFQFSKVIKEIITSEISEMSDASDWLSYEQIANTYITEDHFDEKSFLNSLTDIPKSSSTNIIQAIKMRNECKKDIKYLSEIYTKKYEINNKVNHPCLKTQRNIKSEFSDEITVNIEHDSTWNESDDNVQSVNQMYLESKHKTESISSYSSVSDLTHKMPNKYKISSVNRKLKSRNKMWKCQNVLMLNYYEAIGLIPSPELENAIEGRLESKGVVLKCEIIKDLLKSSKAQIVFSDSAMRIPVLDLKNLYLNRCASVLPKAKNTLITETLFQKQNAAKQIKSLFKFTKNDSFIDQSKFEFSCERRHKRSKSSNIFIDYRYEDFLNPINVFNHQMKLKHRSLSDSHIKNLQLLSSLSKVKESSTRSINTLNLKYPSLIKHFSQELNGKTDLIRSIDFLEFGSMDRFSNKEYIENNKFQSDHQIKPKLFQRKQFIKNKTVTNVEEFQYSTLSNEKIEKNCDLLRFVDFGSTELISSINVVGEGLTKAVVNLPAEILIKTNGQGTDGITLSIEGPAKAEIETCNLLDGDCKVFYVFQTLGEYMLHIQYYGKPIIGSPFRILVKDTNDKTIVTAVSTSRKVYVEGQGLTEAITDFPNHFNIYTKDAGPGGLSLSIEGPSKAIIEFKNSKSGICGVLYRVMEAGIYTCIIKFNRKHINGSPFTIQVHSKEDVSNQCGDSLKSKPLYKVGKKAVFKINLNKLDLKPRVKWFAILCAPSGKRQDICVIYEEKENFLYSEFIPKEIGIHWIYILDDIILESKLNYAASFQIIVEECDDFNVKKFQRELDLIKVFGKGLIKGKAGRLNIFQVEIGESVSGALNVTVDGPSKVEIKCTETENGFRFSYIPAVEGDYIVTIKYGSEWQIKGSPFQVKIYNEDKSNEKLISSRKRLNTSLSQSSYLDSSSTLSTYTSSVMCYGSGLSKAQIHKWNYFYIDASKSRLNHLFISIIGLHEPCEETRICYMEHNRYLVSYKPKEKGAHSLIIKWGDSQILNSPFVIEVE